ncbi:MAG: hypothetical protein HONBIEJF_00010 [Fimbriimonadaceae bacterium]|nr:hypothetical protein [Fimbriimonadaceae bacterium]
MILSFLTSVAFQQAPILTCERTNFAETGDYAEAVAYCQHLDRSNEQAKVITFGKSPQGRDLIALVLSADQRHTLKDLKASPKPVVLINNGIHSGEIEGKDACLMIMRDFIQHPDKYKAITEKLEIVMIPIFSVDAHERKSAFNRINQNGPREMGWRTTANNLNLNRDFIKADAMEMRGMISLIRDIEPDFFFDNHTSDGADFQYHIMPDLPMAQTQSQPAAAFSKALYESVKTAVEKDGFLVAPYFSLADRADPTKGISVSDFGPRYSTGYFAALNRPAMLIETHMLKPYENRVKSTASMVLRTLDYLAGKADELIRMNQSADREASDTKEFVVASRLTSARTPFSFLGFEVEYRDSPVTGGRMISWTDRKKTFESFLRNSYEPSLSIAAPKAYAIPAQYTNVIALLDLHGISYRTLKESVTSDYETYRLNNVKFAAEPFEGRVAPSFTANKMVQKVTLPAGSVIVSVAQPRGKLAVHMLEPSAPDSLMRWGFFNEIFEVKEYFEDYAMEPIARKMLEEDAELRREFEEKLKDAEFAGSSRARLQFFFDRSEYSDERLNVYPILRLP